jgi:RNAse (barnase) inhibitor barstar
MVEIFIAFKVKDKLTLPLDSTSLITGWVTLQLQVISLKFCSFLYEFTENTYIAVVNVITKGLEALEFPKTIIFLCVLRNISLC